MKDQTAAATPVGRPLIIPVFIPHQGCPHRCIFCNQTVITGKTAQTPSPEQLCLEVERYLTFGKRTPCTTQISFFGGNFLGLDESTVVALLQAATPFVRRNEVDGIRFSTRPDTVTRRTLSLIQMFPVTTVELGVQSMNDRVLEVANRGHRAADTVEAADLLKARGYELGLQMMVGLPGDDDDGAMQTARRMAALRPDFVRIYPTVVLRGSQLAAWFGAGRYRPMQLAACIALVKRLYLFFRSLGIAVIRMGLQASDGLTPAGDFIAGPHHPAFGHLVHGEIVRDAIQSTLDKMETLPEPLPIASHPRMISRIQGLNQQNIIHLKKIFGLKRIVLLQDGRMEKSRLMVAGQPVSLP
ncbi:MAG: radical SAM protein [Desulfosarcina sp.]